MGEVANKNEQELSAIKNEFSEFRTDLAQSADKLRNDCKKEHENQLLQLREELRDLSESERLSRVKMGGQLER